MDGSSSNFLNFPIFRLSRSPFGEATTEYKGHAEKKNERLLKTPFPHLDMHAVDSIPYASVLFIQPCAEP